MAWQEGQIVALLTVGGTIVVGVVGQIAAKYGTFSNRQTELEKNLLEQVKSNAARIDDGDKRRVAMEESFRVQLEAAATNARAIERDFREQLKKLEGEIHALERTNEDLRQENWLLKHRNIGLEEVVSPPRSRATMLSPPDDIDKTGETEI